MTTGMNENLLICYYEYLCRNPSDFAGQNVLLIGSSFSAQDIALQSMKYGAKSVTLSYRTKPIGLVWPQGVEEKSIVSGFAGKIVTFQDGSSKEVDAVIMCTGYLHSYPFLRYQSLLCH